MKPKVPGSSLNVSAPMVAHRILTLAAPGWRILNLGSGSGFREGFNRAEFARLRRQVINLDIYLNKGVDVVADGERLPFAPDVFDAMINQAVLEHVAHPQAVVCEIFRTLRPGGYVYIEVPFLQGYHPDPKDFRRFTTEGLEQLLAEFEEVEMGICAGPSTALASFLRYYAAIWFNTDWLSRAAYWLAGWFVFPLKYLDLLLNSKRRAIQFSSALYAWACKPETRNRRGGAV
jgi:SAM-dependent methyltransferase